MSNQKHPMTLTDCIKGMNFTPGESIIPKATHDKLFGIFPAKVDPNLKPDEIRVGNIHIVNVHVDEKDLVMPINVKVSNNFHEKVADWQQRTASRMREAIEAETARIIEDSVLGGSSGSEMIDITPKKAATGQIMQYPPQLMQKITS